MNKRQAKRIADEDTTEYGVFWRGRSGDGLARCTGYRNASIFRRGLRDSSAVILTASEMLKLQTGWRP